MSARNLALKIVAMSGAMPNANDHLRWLESLPEPALQERLTQIACEQSKPRHLRGPAKLRIPSENVYKLLEEKGA